MSNSEHDCWLKEVISALSLIMLGGKEEPIRIQWPLHGLRRGCC